MGKIFLVLFKQIFYWKHVVNIFLSWKASNWSWICRVLPQCPNLCSTKLMTLCANSRRAVSSYFIRKYIIRSIMNEINMKYEKYEKYEKSYMMVVKLINKLHCLFIMTYLLFCLFLLYPSISGSVLKHLGITTNFRCSYQI